MFYSGDVYFCLIISMNNLYYLFHLEDLNNEKILRCFYKEEIQKNLLS
jgi:hypothetical protein